MKRKILVVKLSSMGDTLHALPTVAAIASQLDAEITWAVQPEFASIVRAFSCVSRVIEVPRPSRFGAWLRAILALRREQYDWVIDLQGLLKSALVARAPRALHRIGPGYAREGSVFFYTEHVPRKAFSHAPRRHAIEECFDVLPLLGLSLPETAQFPLTLPPLDPAEVAPLLEKRNGPRIAVAPFSRWETKNWAPEAFAETMRLLHQTPGARLYLIGGKGDAAQAEKILASSQSDAVNLCGKLSILESAALLKQCDLLLTNDSGPMHLSVAVGTPVVAIFGPTLPQRTGPYGKGHVVLQTQACPPCYKRQCHLASHACMTSVSVDSVLNAVCKQLERK